MKFLVRHKFGYDLAPGQVEIVRKIAFRESKRLSISAMTRYGKTQCVAIGTALMVDLTKPTDDFIPKIAFIGPKQEQAGILREYMTDLIFHDPSLLSKAMLSSKGDERIITESSRKKMTFSTGPEYRVFSAEGKADRVMGFGANVIIPDEACLINKEAYIKLMRMLGDAPEDSILIELYNPWDVDNQAYEHSISENFETIQIGYEQAIREGRTTKEHIDEMREECGGENSLEFTVLYKSQFPEMAEDSIFNAAWIRKCMANKFTLWDEVTKIREELKMAATINPGAIPKLKELLKEYKIIIACDPADKGKDFTVIFWGVKHGNQYQILGCYYEQTSDNMAIASKVYDIHKEIGSTHWNIDGHGLGIGVLSRCRQIKSNYEVDVYVKSCLFGGAALSRDKRLYRNQKAVNYFRLRNITKQERIDLPDEGTPSKKMFSELMKMKWKKNPSEQTVIGDPEDKSPDFADGLVYFVWEDKGAVTTVSVG